MHVKYLRPVLSITSEDVINFDVDPSNIPIEDSLHSMLPRPCLSLQTDLAYLTPQIEVCRICVVVLFLELFD